MTGIVERNLIKSLFSSYNEEKELLENGIKLFSETSSSVFALALQGHKIVSDDFRANTTSIYSLMDKERLMLNFHKKYWNKAFEITKVRSVMPSKRIEEWNKTIENGEFPEFTIENVSATVFGFFSSSRQYMAEKVDGILNSLSSNYKTNKSDQITEKFIFDNALWTKGYPSVNSHIENKINDLRSLIRQINGENDYKIFRSHDMMMDLYSNHSGEWVYMDGNAFRIKFYKKGTAHIQLNPEIVEEMCVLLSELYPMQISHKTEFVKLKKEFKEYPLKKEMISAETASYLGGKMKVFLNPLSDRRAFFRTYDDEDDSKQVWKEEIDQMIEEYPFNFEIEHSTYEQSLTQIPKEVFEIFSQIGVVKRKYRHLVWFAANYDVLPLMKKLAYRGFVDDYKSFQFYPTKAELAQKVIEYASFDESVNSVLEPSAGQGGICDLIPLEKAKISCVEISETNSYILGNKGFNVVASDFIAYANKTKDRYDRIVMNPPFSKGRAKLHVQEAFTLLNENGILVAVIPSTYLGTEIVSGATHTYSEILEDCFDNTKVSVVIVRIEK